MHKSVLSKETITLLKVEKTGTYFDLTLGGGGHSIKILDQLKNGTLICFDVDEKSLTDFEKILNGKKYKKNEDSNLFSEFTGENKVYLINDNFINLSKYKDISNSINGIIADLGWSSDQLGEIPGLSYERSDEELDMRFDKKLGVKASDLLNVLGRKELKEMFERYSDIYGMKNNELAEEIMKQRKRTFISKTSELLEIIDRVYKLTGQNRIHRDERYKNYSKVFQALRIAVNSELTNLETLLVSGFDLLNKGGIFEIITFHSGEDKIMANFINKKKKAEELEIISNDKGEIYIRSSVEELMDNLKARSAKLFGFKKLRKK